MKFVHSRFRYEVEIHSDLIKGNKKPSEFEMTSQKPSKNLLRFYTPKLRNLLEELDQSEEKLKDAITPFVNSLFQNFYESRHIWQPLV